MSSLKTKISPMVFHLFSKLYWNKHLDIKTFDSNSCCMNSGYGQTFFYLLNYSKGKQDFKSDTLPSYYFVELKSFDTLSGLLPYLLIE